MKKPELDQRIRNAHDIAAWRLCSGCGACRYICPENNIVLRNVCHDGIRPFIKNVAYCRDCCLCLEVCPSFLLQDQSVLCQLPHISDDQAAIRWGRMQAIYEGFSSDDTIRFKASSGGAATALAKYCLEQLGYAGVLHVGSNPIRPYENVTVFSRDSEGLLENVGSRYSPASPCDALHHIREAKGPCVFIGKPCDVVAIRQAAALDPALRKNIGLIIGIFCAGTPSTRGTLELLGRNGMDPKTVETLRYRGYGWPGEMSGIDRRGRRMRLLYKDAWGFLQVYRPLRCHLCPDGTSELADIACGDAWYKIEDSHPHGLSLVLPRTDVGADLLHGARSHGFLCLESATLQALQESQINLLNKKKAIWGRIAAMRIARIPYPRFEASLLYANWMTLSLREKIRTVTGTLRRIATRGYFRPRVLTVGPD